MSFDEWFKENVMPDPDEFFDRIWNGGIKGVLREVYEAGVKAGRKDKDYEC